MKYSAFLYKIIYNYNLRGGDFTVCPNCGVEIKRFDLAPNCKKCGINIMYFNQEEELTLDAKRTELEFAKARAIVGRIKTTYIGDTLSVIRMVLGILTVTALVIPFMNISLNLPMVTAEFSTGALGIYQMIGNGFISRLLTLGKLGTEGALASALLCHCVFFALTALAEVCMFVTFLLESIDIRRGTKFLTVFSFTAFIFNLGSIITSFIAKAAAAETETVSVNIGFGAFVLAAMLIAYIIINIVLYKRNPQHIIPEIDVKRIELLKKIKAGEISYDDLPLPIFETEEEREKRLNLFGAVEDETEKEKKKKNGGLKNE